MRSPHPGHRCWAIFSCPASGRPGQNGPDTLPLCCARPCLSSRMRRHPEPFFSCHPEEAQPAKDLFPAAAGQRKKILRFVQEDRPGRAWDKRPGRAQADRRGGRGGARKPPRTESRPGRQRAGAGLGYLMALVSTSSWSLAAKSARDMAPRSPSERWRGETVAFSTSLSPTTSI